MNVKSAKDTGGQRSTRPSGQGKQPVSTMAVVIAFAVLAVGLFFMYRMFFRSNLPSPEAEAQIRDNDATRRPDPDEGTPGMGQTGGGTRGDRPSPQDRGSLAPQRDRVFSVRRGMTPQLAHAPSRSSLPPTYQGWGQRG